MRRGRMASWRRIWCGRRNNAVQRRFRDAQQSPESPSRGNLSPSWLTIATHTESQMPAGIHPFVQDAHHVDAPGGSPIEHHVRTRGKLPIPWSYLIASPAAAPISGNRLDCRLQPANVEFGLIQPPAFGGEIPDGLDIRPCVRRQDIEAHGRCDVALRLPAMKASKSNGTDGPLASPSIKAARSALNCASCCSSRRKPARTTSLTEA